MSVQIPQFNRAWPAGDVEDLSKIADRPEIVDRERFDCSVPAFLQRLFRVDDDAALQVDAVTVIRLRAHRERVRSLRVPVRAGTSSGAVTRSLAFEGRPR